MNKQTKRKLKKKEKICKNKNGRARAIFARCLDGRREEGSGEPITRGEGRRGHLTAKYRSKQRSFHCETRYTGMRLHARYID